MNNYGESLLTSMSIMFKDTLEKEKLTRVVEAIIVDLLDSSIGLYSIKYENQVLKAYTNNVAIKYNTDDKVFVLCQDGTLDGRLFIIGAQNPYSGLYTTDTSAVKYTRVADSLVVLNNDDDIELCTYQSDMETDVSFIRYGDDNFTTICNHYLDKYKTFAFQFNVRTNITDIYQRVDGDYGIIMRIPFIKDGQNIVKEYVYNIDTMEGDPYNFNTATLQTNYIQFEEGLQFDRYNSISFKAFVKNFKRDITILTPDIFISNVEFFPVEVLDEASLSGYYLKLQATEGNFFAGSWFESTKTITPTFLIDGVETTLEGLDCYWFVQDASITPSSADYSRFGGTGWKLLKKDETNPSLEISVNDIKTSLVYKAVVLYNNSSVSQTIKIENLNSQIKLEVKTKSNIIIEGSGDVYIDVDVTYCDGYTKSEDETLVYKFSRYDYQGNYIDDSFFDWIKKNEKTTQGSDTIYSSEIKFDASLILNGMNIIDCSVYSLTEDGMVLLGTESLAIVTTVGADFILSMQNADFLYKYDADGDSPMCEAYDGPISSIIRSIEPLSFKIYKKDGTEFDSSEYGICHTTWELPNNSLMNFGPYPTNTTVTTSEDGEWTIVTGNGLIEIPYTIANVYDIKKINNTARLTVECDRNGSVVKGTTNLLFSKDGEAGTNGTKFAALISYLGFTYGEINSTGIPNKFQMIWDATAEKWYAKNPITNRPYDTEFSGVALDSNSGFKVRVFSDGEEIIDSTLYQVLEWSLFDSRHISPYFSINGSRLVATEGWYDSTESKACILQAKIKVAEGDIQGKDLIVYAYYPIEISYVTEITEGMPVPAMEDGFNTVLYSNDGSNPRYNSAKKFHCVDGLYNNDINDIYDYQWTSSINLNKRENTTGSECKFEPISKYDNGESNNYIRATLVTSQSATTELQNKIDELDAKCSALSLVIADKDAVLTQLNDLSSNYRMAVWKNNISQLEVLATREMMLEICKSSLQYLDEFKECFGTTSYPYMSVYNSKVSTINGALSPLRKLISTGNLSSIPSFISDTVLITITDNQKETIINDLGVGVYNQVEKAVLAFNTSITDYRTNYNKIMNTDPEEIVKLHLNYSELNNYCNEDSLTALVSLNADEFKGFSDGLKALALKFTSGEEIVSKKNYEDILDKIVDLSQFYVTDLNTLNTAVANQYDTTEDVIRYNNLVAEKEGYEQQLVSVSALTSMVHIKPIIFTLNRYGYSYLNEWDGNKIYVNDENDYILSPLVGAGKKESDNSYTGLLMGAVRENNGLDEKVGLIGLHRGERSIFLDAETGKAEFGKSGAGQIILDPSNNKAEIKSGNYSTQQGTGMLIDLTTPKIEFGSGNFKVDADGHATIKGGGDIGGWQVNQHDLKSYNNTITLEAGDSTHLPNIHSNSHDDLNDTVNGFYLGGDGISIGNHFRYIQNVLTLGSGNKRWTVASNGSGVTEESYIGYATETLNGNENNSVYLGTDGLRLGKQFKVSFDNNGKGKLELGKIGTTNKWTFDTREVEIEPGSIETYSYMSYNTSAFNTNNNSIYVGTDGISLGREKFYVTNDGDLTSKSGHIADFKITDKALFTSVTDQQGNEENGEFEPNQSISSNNVYLGKDGIRLGRVTVTSGSGGALNRTYKFCVNKSGDLICNSGLIAGWEVTNNKIQKIEDPENPRGNGIIIDSNGSIRSWNEDWILNKNGNLFCRNVAIQGGNITITNGNDKTFHVDSSGQMSCTGADIRGIIRADQGNIGNFYIDQGALYTEYKYTIDTPGAGIHFSGSGLAIADTFKVTSNGDLTANSGLIGGILLDSNGLYVTNKFRINKNGTISCSAISCTGGTIGCLNISANEVEIGTSGLSLSNSGIYSGGGFYIHSAGGGLVNTNQLKTTTFYLNGDQVGWRTLNYLDHSGSQQVMYVLGAYV